MACIAKNQRENLKLNEKKSEFFHPQVLPSIIFFS